MSPIELNMVDMMCLGCFWIVFDTKILSVFFVTFGCLHAMQECRNITKLGFSL